MTIFWLIFSGNSHTLPGCLPFIKKFRKILVGNFGSVKTVRVVPKISGLSRRASRLDSEDETGTKLTKPDASVSPPPRLLRTICPPCRSRGWGICKFCVARGHSRAFDTHAVSCQNITTQMILLGKVESRADWLLCQGQVCYAKSDKISKMQLYNSNPPIYYQDR